MENDILKCLQEEKQARLRGGLYHYTQIKFTYNTNRIEGSKLTEDQTRYIYETFSINTGEKETANVNDIIETVNHFKCFDYMLGVAREPLTEDIIKELHKILKQNSIDSFKEWFKIGDYKQKPNFVGDTETVNPLKVKENMGLLIADYSGKETHDVNDIIKFHYNFERIHPFQDGNGRVGRLIMFKECLKNNIVPFIIENENKQFYYMGLKEYPKNVLRLNDTCLFGQDKYKEAVNYFNNKGGYIVGKDSPLA
jgi:Fic family protein